MSLKNWLRQEGLLACHPALRNAGVQKPSDLCQLQEVDIHELGQKGAWRILTQRKMIQSMNTLKKRKPKVAKPPKSASRSRWKATSTPGNNNVLIGNLRKNDENRRRKRKVSKQTAANKKKSWGNRDFKIGRISETPMVKRVQASTMMRNQYKEKAAGTNQVQRKGKKYNYKSEEKNNFSESTRVALSSYTNRGYQPGSFNTKLSSEEVLQCNIPKHLPIVMTLKHCCEAIEEQLLDCTRPKIPTNIQQDIEGEVQGFKDVLRRDFVGALHEEKEYKLDEIKALIKLIDMFKIMLDGRLAKLEEIHKKLLKEKPDKDNDLLRRMDEHLKTLATHKEFAIDYLNAINDLEACKKKLAVIDHKTFAEMKVMKQPPKVLRNLLTGVCMIFGMSKPSWRDATSFICGNDMRNKLLNFDPKVLDPKARNKATKFIVQNMESFNPVRVKGVNRKAVSLADWVEGLNRVFEVFMKLEQFPDGDMILNQIQKAHSELMKNKEQIWKMEKELSSWQGVLQQLSWNLKLLKHCQYTQSTIKKRREKTLKYLEWRERENEVDEIILPENYKIPFEEACKKIRTQFGALTEAELNLVFSMIKKYFLVMIRLFKTYASLEGKKRQGLYGMSTTMWGVCCKSMELGEFFVDEAQELLHEIFNRSAMKTMRCNKHSVDLAAFRVKTLGKIDAKKDQSLTGVWQNGEGSTKLWVIESRFGGLFSGFIGSQRNAIINGEISEGNVLHFRITWGKESGKAKLAAKCNAIQVNGTTLRVKYSMSNKKKGYWILKKTGAKVRTQNKGRPALEYSSFVEALIRLSIRIRRDLSPWKAIEVLMENYVTPKAFTNWDVIPETNDTVQQYFNRKEVKSILCAIFRKYGVQRSRSTILIYPRWEKLVRNINTSATGVFATASLRTTQFSFFTSKVMFPVKGPLDALSYREFICAIARLSYKMVTIDQGLTSRKPKLSLQCKTMISWLKRKQW